MIITKSDFNTDIKIANKSDVAVMEDLNNFINTYEPEFLNMLLGSDFATLFVAGISVLPAPDQRWTDLLNVITKKAIASYIYYWYLRDQDAQVVGTGTVKSSNQNSTIYTSRDKVCRAWDSMRTKCWETQKYLQYNSDVYPEYIAPRWYQVFARTWWSVWQWSVDIFASPFYMAFRFASFYQIPDIYYPLSRL